MLYGMCWRPTRAGSKFALIDEQHRSTSTAILGFEERHPGSGPKGGNPNCEGLSAALPIVQSSRWLLFLS
jgi:hypothetical protein